MSQLNVKRNRGDRIFRRPSSLRIGITIILHEEPHLVSNNSDTINNHIRALNNCYIFHCTNNLKCIKYLKRAQRHEYIIILYNIINDSINISQIAELCQYQQVQHIFIVSLTNEQHESIDTDLSVYTRNEINKIGGVFYDYKSLEIRLQQQINELNDSDDDLFTFVNQSEKALRNLREELGPYIWSQTYRVILSAMPYNSNDAKRDMLTECRACCFNPHDLRKIDEFRHTYTPMNAIYWYTKSCFLYRIINRALRTEDNLMLYKFRFFIVDLCTRLEEKALTKINCTAPFCVYRGSKLRRDEVEKLEVGSLVATNSFFSCSRHLHTAENFIGISSTVDMSPSRGRNERFQYVLFQIDIDLNKSPDVVVADVSNESAVPDENEMLFNLGTTFIIIDIKYDEIQRVWHIQMTSSSEVSKLMQEYRQHVQSRFIETKPVILFGHFTSEISSNYHGALSYFHRLLRSKSWDDEDRPDIIYYCLGRVYRAMGKSQQSITYLRAALLLQRRLLPESSMIYGRMLSCLGNVYCESGDLLRGKNLYEQAMIIYRGILPKNHYEFGFHLNRLANVYWQIKQYESASNLLKNTLLFVKDTMPEKSPAHAQTLHIMGLVQRSLNNREEAIYYFKESIKIREALQANDHPQIARTCCELSELYVEENNYSVALEYAYRSLRIRESKLPLNHPQRQQSIDLVERLNHLYNKTLSSFILNTAVCGKVLKLTGDCMPMCRDGSWAERNSTESFKNTPVIALHAPVSEDKLAPNRTTGQCELFFSRYKSADFINLRSLEIDTLNEKAIEWMYNIKTLVSSAVDYSGSFHSVPQLQKLNRLYVHDLRYVFDQELPHMHRIAGVNSFALLDIFKTIPNLRSMNINLG
ncbi:hypothetical protein I4U23_003767 [Adineta vaga]|nr:hypothetical protein I4U23_003767 [Adineta vaga]